MRHRHHGSADVHVPDHGVGTGSSAELEHGGVLGEQPVEGHLVGLLREPHHAVADLDGPYQRHRSAAGTDSVECDGGRRSNLDALRALVRAGSVGQGDQWMGLYPRTGDVPEVRYVDVVSWRGHDMSVTCPFRCIRRAVKPAYGASQRNQLATNFVFL